MQHFPVEEDRKCSNAVRVVQVAYSQCYQMPSSIQYTYSAVLNQQTWCIASFSTLRTLNYYIQYEAAPFSVWIAHYIICRHTQKKDLYPIKQTFTYIF